MRVGIRCDAGPGLGVGHLVRCVALAEEFLARGWQPLFLADLGGVAFAERQLHARALSWVAAPEDAPGHLAAVSAHGLDAVVVDSYTLPPEVTARLVDVVPVLAVVDGPLRGQTAHVYVDQNIGAEDDAVTVPAGARRLAGTRYALLRDAVRRSRPPQPWQPRTGPPEVVMSFGGTDAFGLTAAAAAALLSSGVAVRLTAVTTDERVRAALEADSHGPSLVRAVAPHDDFPSLLARADLVVGAAGTSVWEYCCLGRPAAVAAVVDNQVQAYERLVAQGAVLPLGRLESAPPDPARLAHALAAALDETARARAAAIAYDLLDGRGRERVADALAAAYG